MTRDLGEQLEDFFEATKDRTKGWLPMETAPKGVLIEGLDSDGQIDWVEYRETRQCMLSTVAKGAGECGPGWVSEMAGYLPIDPPVAWRPISSTTGKPE